MQIGERRQVSVLFCDLVDSVGTSSQLDPEEWFEVVDAYYELTKKIVASFNGYIAEYIGDGIMAYFGYPTSDEEAACNAIRAGLALSEEIPHLPSAPNIRLHSRIGVATGIVVVKVLEIDETRSKATLVGETPNLAARLQAIANKDSVVIASATKNIADGLFDCISLGVHDFKGFSSPLEAFEVKNSRFASSRSQIRAGKSRPVLYGREQEVSILKEHWQKAKEGETALLLLQGDAGMGKSSLVENLRHSLVLSGEKHQTWFCGPNHTLSALHPIAEQLMRLAGFEAGDQQEIRRKKLYELLHIFGVDDPESQITVAELLGMQSSGLQAKQVLTPEKRKEIRLETFLRMLQNWAADKPILIIVEDLHWVDPSTLELLDEILASDRFSGCLILATARQEFVPNWKVPYKCVQLERLTMMQSINLCQAVDSDNLIAADTARAIVGRCDGNPLYIEELTKSVIEDMKADHQNSAKSSIFIPDTLQDSLVARLDRLGTARRVASIGAVIGRSFSYEMITSVTEQTREEIDEALEKLLDSGLAYTSTSSTGCSYQFKHALVRDSAYSMLLKRDRQALHRKIAIVLRDQFPAICEAEPQLLALHFTESGAIDEAIPLWVEAGNRMADSAAHAEAVSHFQKALNLIKGLPEDSERSQLELTVLIAIAVSLSASKGYSVPEVGETLNRAQLIASSSGDDDTKFAILRGICNFKIVAGDMESAERISMQCLDISKTTCKPEHRIEADTPLGYVYFATGRLREAATCLEHSLSLYDKHDGLHLPFPCPQDPKIVCLSTLLHVYMALGLFEAAEDASTRLRAHIETMETGFQSTFGHVYLSWHALDMQAYKLSMQYSDIAKTLCELNGYTFHGGSSKFLHAVAMARLDNSSLEQYIEQAEGAIDLLLKLGSQHAIPHRMGELAGLYARAGEMERARKLSREAVDMARRVDDNFFIPLIMRRQLEYELQAAAVSGDSSGQWKLERLRSEALASAEAMGAQGFVSMIKQTWASSTDLST
jgi:class 3 adenylate cyclase/tetratricopeptide (TPR) repeat protein